MSSFATLLSIVPTILKFPMSNRSNMILVSSKLVSLCCFPVMHSLEHCDNRGKAATLKKVIQLVLNGERFPGLLMTIIRFVLPCNDHEIKKLLLIFWEIWPKTSGDGKLLHEMILVCDAYRKVRGVAVVQCFK